MTTMDDCLYKDYLTTGELCETCGKIPWEDMFKDISASFEAYDGADMVSLWSSSFKIHLKNVHKTAFSENSCSVCRTFISMWLYPSNFPVRLFLRCWYVFFPVDGNYKLSATDSRFMSQKKPYVEAVLVDENKVDSSGQPQGRGLASYPIELEDGNKSLLQEVRS